MSPFILGTPADKNGALIRSKRINGNRPSFAPEMFPWQASFHKEIRGEAKTEILAGGAVVAPYVIATSAFVFSNTEPEDWVVTVGHLRGDLYDAEAEVGYQERQVKNITRHEYVTFLDH